MSYPNVVKARREGDFKTLSELGKKGAEARQRSLKPSLRSFYKSAPRKEKGPKRPLEQKIQPVAIQQDLFIHHPLPF